MYKVNNENIEKAFMAAFNLLPQIDYNPKWANGTGYFNGAAQGEHAAIDQVCASVDEHGRQIIIVPNRDTAGNPFNIVYFRRFTDNNVFIVHGCRLAYLKSTGKFAAVAESARPLWDEKSVMELELLETLQYGPSKKAA